MTTEHLLSKVRKHICQSYSQILLVLLLWLFFYIPNVYADRVTVKALYAPARTWITKYNEDINIYLGGVLINTLDYSQKDTYQLQSGYGVGVEYEWVKPQDLFSYSFGIDHYFPRPIPEVHQEYECSGFGLKGDQDVSLYNMSYQTTYYFGKLKIHFNDSLYAGCIFQLAQPLLVGSGWEKWLGSDGDIVKSYVNYGLIAGVIFDHFTFDVSLIKENLRFIDASDMIGRKATLDINQDQNSIFSLMTFSLGFFFDLSKASASLDDNNNDPNTETQKALNGQSGTTLVPEFPTKNAAP